MDKIDTKISFYSKNITELNKNFGDNHSIILDLIKGKNFNFNYIINDDKFNKIENLSEILKDFMSIDTNKLQNSVINSINTEINDNFMDFLVKYFIKKRTFYLYVYVLLRNTINSKNNELLESIKKTENKEEINIIVDKIKEENNKKLEEYNKFITVILPMITGMEKST